MKILSTTLLIIFSQMILFAQCPPGDLLLFSSQAQIDDFKISYPNCTELDADVAITGGIVNLYGLSNLTTIEGNLSFLYNTSLSNMLGLENLTSVGGDLIILENYTMTSTMGLGNLVSVGNDLLVSNNNFLNGLSGLSSLTSVGNILYVGYSAKVSGFTGLESLVSIGNGLEVEHNPLLTSFDGLESLASIGGNLLVQFNETLVSLEGLQALTSIGGDLEIRSNYDLGSLAGLDNIAAASIGDLTIMSNFELNTCEVLSICNYLSSPGGNILITNNAEGCNNQQEVEDACVWVGMDEEAILESISIYPNPCISTLNIELTGDPSENTFLTLSNTNGQEIISRQLKEPRTEINISSLPSGLYIARLWNDKNVLVKKVIRE